MAKPITKTFEQWCLDSERQDLLDRWDYELNDKLPSEVGFSSTYQAFFKCNCGGNHKSSQHCLNKPNKDRFYCRYNNTFKQWCVDNNHLDYLELWATELNGCTPEDVEYRSNKKYYFYCRNNKNHKPHFISLNNLTRCIDGLTVCLECDNFEIWCYNNRHDLLERWDYDKNEYKPNELFRNTNIKIWLKCPCGIHESEQHSLANIASARNKEVVGKCRKCNSFAQYLLNTYGEGALDKYWDFEKNILNPWLIDKAARKDIYIKCQEKSYHGSYKTNCVSFTSKGCRCSYCNDTKTVHRMDSVGYLYPEIQKYWDGDIEELYFISPHSNFKYNFICEKHGKFKRTMADAIECNHICPDCSKEQLESMLQLKVSEFINSRYCYTLLHENNCTCLPINPRTNYPLPFDNEILELKLIIEVHGIQHYEPSGFHVLTARQNNTTPEEEFKYQQWKDKFKKEYALSNGYLYLEIPYWMEENNLYQELIINKIDKILQESQPTQDSLLLCSNL